MSVTDDSGIRKLLRDALTDEITSREMFMKGIDYSYYYESGNSCASRDRYVEPYGFTTDFIDYALLHPELMFYVTPIGCGIAGWTPEEIAPLFKSCKDMQNVALPECFWEVLEKNGASGR